MQVDLTNWSAVLSQSNLDLKEKTIFYNTSSKTYVFADRKATDANMQKLSFHDIVNHAKAMEQAAKCNYIALKNMTKVLDQMTIRAEQKHFFLRLNRALKTTFNFSFSTTTETVRDLSRCLSLKQATLSTKKLEDFTITTYTTDQKVERKALLEFKKKASTIKNDQKAERRVKLGKGVQGTVFDAHNNRAVKKVRSQNEKALETEYRIGAILDHHHLAKSHSLHKSPSSHYITQNHYLVMDKIEGKRLADIVSVNAHLSPNHSKLTNETVLKNLDQAKNCCLYLFDENITWADVNSQNIFVDKQNNLKICDFGAWSLEANPQTRALKLLLGSMETADWLLKASQSDDPKKNRSELIYPTKFFNTNKPSGHIFSQRLFNLYTDNPTDPSFSWVTALAKKLEHMNNQEIKEFLADYFDQVKAKFSEKISTQNH